MRPTSSPAEKMQQIALLVTDGFEQVELTGPRDALQAAGHTTHVLAPQSEPVQGYHHDKKGDTFQVDGRIAQAQAGDYDAVVLPGGVMNGDALRMDAAAQRFLQAMQDAGKPIAVICHGGWLLIDAGLARGRTVTSWPSLATDFRNAGATWVDESVHQDGNLITSRKPEDIPAFNGALLAALQKTGAR